ncbi:lyase family protein [Pelagimonas varians]|uniref:3-carboxy-cis,cis-muconate cycloisomerase n=1 Tax=Pelagimonas varians TaxID=696760 RepID=A0A238K1Z9_9RHOB|nr:lyase family protein [Pelagimonas varians]PYG33252.1 3-carboxy-cis,cis-muconate cycloisomerase [Pelagimonas varians]SMX36132.1 3-carboxy-cis,cis-muconate cycloisomerase [Pelagimonas varians]
MPATPFDSLHLSALFTTGDTGRLFSDSAEIRAMMLVHGSLALAQADAGVIPMESAKAIQRASLELQIDPAGLAASCGQNGVTVPGLVDSFRKNLQAPEHGQYLHWGATSQDIQDTGLMLRMKRALGQMQDNLRAILAALAALADQHAETPMAARSYGQHATPTSFGAMVASWGWPLLDALQAVPDLRRDTLLVSLAGASGTASELGPDPAALRAALAEKLGLGDPGRSWHSDRTPILKQADWMTRVSMALGKLGEDLILATQSGQSEITLGGAGGSSTMPQKQNPVGPSALVALARHVQGLNATLQGAGLHRQQRDGAAWFTEWLTFPQLVQSTASALTHGKTLAEGMHPNTDAMQRALDNTGGLILAEALSFALAAKMPRPQAQAAAKALCLEAREKGLPLADLSRAAHPDLPADLFEMERQMGIAPDEARNFAAAVRAL